MKRIEIKRSSIVEIKEDTDKHSLYLVTTIDADTFIGIRCEPFTDDLINSFPFRRFDVVIRTKSWVKYIANPYVISTINYSDIIDVEGCIPYGQYIQIMQLVQNAMLGSLCYIASDNLMIYQNGFQKYRKNIEISETPEVFKYDEKISDVKKQNDEFMSSIDLEKPISDFISEKCDIGIDCRISVISLYREYAKWCSTNDRTFVDSITFQNYFTKKFCILNDSNADIILGIELHVDKVEEIVCEETTSIEFEVTEESTAISIPRNNSYDREVVHTEHHQKKSSIFYSSDLTSEDVDFIKNSSTSVQDIAVKFNIPYASAATLKTKFRGAKYKNDYDTFLGEYSEDDLRTIVDMKNMEVAELFSITMHDASCLRAFCKRKLLDKGKVYELELSEEDIEFISLNTGMKIAERFNINIDKANNLRWKYKKVFFSYTHYGNYSKFVPTFVNDAAKRNDEFFRDFEMKSSEYFKLIDNKKMYITKENFIKEYGDKIPSDIIDGIYMNIHNRNASKMANTTFEKLSKAVDSKNANALAYVCKQFYISPIDAYRKIINRRKRQKNQCKLV